MAGMSDALEASILKQLFWNIAGPQPATLFVSLHTAPLVDAGTGAEVSGGSYARVSCTTGTSGTGAGSVFATFTSPSPTQIANSAAITFPSPTANWGTVTDFGIWSAATTGTLYFLGTLTVARTINSGDSAPNFAIGALTITLD